MSLPEFDTLLASHPASDARAIAALEATVIASLKRDKDDVREVRSGFECGIGLNNFDGYQNGDLIEFYVSERVN